MRRRLALGAALVLAVAGAGVIPGGGDRQMALAASSGAMPYDFDGDGYADLTVGVTGEDVDGAAEAGAVQVLYGSASGPTDRDQLWHQGQPGIADAAEGGDRFGGQLASRDFDRDGYADLAIGVAGEDMGATPDAGAVQVLYGSSGGLTNRNQLWHQDTPGVPGANESQDFFGSGLAAGDFDGDGFGDLAISVAGEDGWSGRVVTLHGSASGLTSIGSASFQQGTGGVGRVGDTGAFGGPLAAGDVTGDGRDDLVIGASVRRLCRKYGECPPTFYLLRGDPGGLTAAGSQFIDGEGDLGVGYTGGGGASLGDVTLSDFNRDGRADLAFTAQEHAVAVLHGHGDGFRAARLRAPGVPGRDTVWSIPGWAEDESGTLSSGDLTGDGYPDLVVQVDDPIMVFPGSAAGLGGSIIQWPVPSYANLTALPLSGGTHAWLVAPVDGPGLPSAAGAVIVLRGTPAGAPGAAVVWHQDSPGIQDDAQEDDFFGWSLP